MFTLVLLTLSWGGGSSTQLVSTASFTQPCACAAAQVTANDVVKQNGGISGSGKVQFSTGVQASHQGVVTCQPVPWPGLPACLLDQSTAPAPYHLACR